MAKALELKYNRKSWTQEGFGYGGVAKLHLHFQMIPLAASEGREWSKEPSEEATQEMLGQECK